MAITPSIALIPSGYKDGLIYSKLPINGQADLNFLRGGSGGSARRFTKEGLLEEVSGNTPRLNWEQSNNPSLLIEDTSRNIVTYSEEFTRANWNKINITVTGNEQIAPDGNKSADKIQRTSTSASYISDSLDKSSSSAINMSASFFVQKGSGDYGAVRVQGLYPARVDLQFRYSTSEVVLVTSTTFTATSSSIKEVKKGFFRVCVSFITDNHPSLSPSFSPRSSQGQIDSTDTSSDAYAYLWGAQLEENSYSSSYIPNFGTGSGVTRLKESFSKSGLSEYIDSQSGVLEVRWRSFSNNLFKRAISINDNTGFTSNEVFIEWSNVSNKVEVRYQGGGTSCLVSGISPTPITEFNTVKVKWNYDGLAVKINNIELGTNTNITIQTAGRMNTVSSTRGNGADFFQGDIEYIQIYKGIEKY